MKGTRYRFGPSSAANSRTRRHAISRCSTVARRKAWRRSSPMRAGPFFSLTARILTDIPSDPTGCSRRRNDRDGEPDARIERPAAAVDPESDVAILVVAVEAKILAPTRILGQLVFPGLFHGSPVPHLEFAIQPDRMQAQDTHAIINRGSR